jgi:hypothetical protein
MYTIRSNILYHIKTLRRLLLLFQPRARNLRLMIWGWPYFAPLHIQYSLSLLCVQQYRRLDATIVWKIHWTSSEIYIMEKERRACLGQTHLLILNNRSQEQNLSSTSGKADLLAQNSCTLGYNDLNNLVLLPCWWLLNLITKNVYNFFPIFEPFCAHNVQFV